MLIRIGAGDRSAIRNILVNEDSVSLANWAEGGKFLGVILIDKLYESRRLESTPDLDRVSVGSPNGHRRRC